MVGAGPAGIAAARELTRGGVRAILLDRHARPGGKACGGGITREGWELGGVDGRGENPFSLVEVRSPLGSRVVDAGAPFVEIVDRVAWQEGLIEEARSAGCEVRLGERFLGFDGGEVRTESGTFLADLLVGADGAASRVRRSLGIPVGPAVIARQSTIPFDGAAAAGLPIDRPVVFFDPARFGCGYGWSFPAPDGIRLGCGAPSSAIGPGRLREAFRRWLADLGVAARRVEEAAGTIGCGYVGHRFGRVRLAGDAAGLASPVTGEGIGQALISGEEVAREILEDGYRSEIIPALGKRHRRTAGVLATPVGALLFRLAPAILSIPSVRVEAVRRYCR